MKTFQDGYEPENYKQQIISEITDLVKDYIRQRPVKWSEEDERMRKDIIRVLKGEIRYISGKKKTKNILIGSIPLWPIFYEIGEINKKHY